MTNEERAALVKRLRRTYRKEYAPTGSTVGNNANRLHPFPILAVEVAFNPDGPEAADLIEAQAKRIEELNEKLAAAYIELSGKTEHASDCATSNAPALEPGPCDCEEKTDD